MDKEPPQNNPQTEQVGCLAVIARITWMAFGNLLLIIVAFSIVQQKAGIVLDVIFWAVVTGLIFIRYIDINVLGGQTTDFKPATLQHWRRYSLLLLLASGVLGLLAHEAVHVL